MTGVDAISRRLLSLSEALAHLDRPECRDPARLLVDATLRAAVERWLQVSIEACLDVAHNMIASEAWTPAPTGRAAFTTLAAHGVILPDLAQRLGRAVGLRNLLVHDYADVDVARLAAIVAADLDDLRAFARVATGLIERGPAG